MHQPTNELPNKASEVDFTILPTSSISTGKSQPVVPNRYRWRSSFWRVRPLLGLIAIIMLILCMLVSLVILEASNGDVTSKWSIQPTVYLAGTTAISNAALQCALAQAAPISWWYKALRGSTIKDLELDWAAGQSFPRAFVKSFKYRRMVKLFGFASLATALVLIDGPLLQRSSSVRRATTVDIVPMNVSLAPQLPPGFSVKLPEGCSELGCLHRPQWKSSKLTLGKNQ